MSDSADILAQVDASIAQALNNIPDSETTRAAAITVCLAAAKRLAATEPKELQEVWAEKFYQVGDELAAPQNDPT
jgi:hypothetical protein